jgi:hypothetical protein
LRRAYSARRTASYFAAWAHEDAYVPLADELTMLSGAGFRPEIIWREGALAVILGLRL